MVAYHEAKSVGHHNITAVQIAIRKAIQLTKETRNEH
jgi:hypothetical protein